MIRKICLALILVGLPLAAALAASWNGAFIFNGVVSTSVSCTNLGPFTMPTAAGTVLGKCTVLPSGWSGILTLSGTGSSAFAMSGWNITNVAAYSTAGTVNLTVTSTP